MSESLGSGDPPRNHTLGETGGCSWASLKAEHRSVPGQVWREGCMASQPGAQSCLGFRGPPTTGSPRSPQPQATELSTHTAGLAISSGPDEQGSTPPQGPACWLPAAPTQGQGLSQQAPPAPHATGTNSIGHSLEGDAHTDPATGIARKLSPLSSLKSRHQVLTAAPHDTSR